jgi:hypothetical protein
MLSLDDKRWSDLKGVPYGPGVFAGLPTLQLELLSNYQFQIANLNFSPCLHGE